MELLMFMPTTLVGHVAKHCNHAVNIPDENNIIGGVYRQKAKLSNWLTSNFASIWHQRFKLTYSNFKHNINKLLSGQTV